MNLTPKEFLRKSKMMELNFYKVDRINIRHKQRLSKPIKIFEGNKRQKINIKNTCGIL